MFLMYLGQDTNNGAIFEFHMRARGLRRGVNVAAYKGVSSTSPRTIFTYKVSYHHRRETRFGMLEDTGEYLFLYVAIINLLHLLMA